MFKTFTMKTIVLTTGLVLSLVAVGAMASTTGSTEFGAIYTRLTQWTDGTLGRIIALGMIIVGLGIGVVRQSIMGVVVGVGGGLVMSQAPTLVSGIIGSVI
jgi:conjugal transfer pilus assembly protein TraA